MVGLSPATSLLAAGVGTSSLIHSISSSKDLSDRLPIAIEASATSLSALQRQINSLAQVTLQNRRALDLLTAEKGGTCLFLREECCYYLNESGLVETNIEHLKEIQKTLPAHPGSSDPLTSWWQSPHLTWLLPIVTPLVSICIILMLLPCFLRFIWKRIHEVSQVAFHQMVVRPYSCIPTSDPTYYGITLTPAGSSQIRSLAHYHQ